MSKKKAATPAYPFGPGLTMSAPWGRTEYLHADNRPVDVQGDRESLLAAGILDEWAQIPRGITGLGYTSMGRVMVLADGRVRVRARAHIEVVRLNASFQRFLSRAVHGTVCPDFNLPRPPKRRRSPQ